MRLFRPALPALGDVLFQAAQHGGKSGAASERNDPDGRPTAVHKFFHGENGKSAG